MNDKLWILVAGGSEARIFATEKLSSDWVLKQEFSHPEAREKDVDLVADKYGEVKDNFEARGSSYAEPTDPKETEIDNFARQLAKELNLGRTRNEYKKLVVIAPPHFQGLLTKHCDKHTLNLIIKHLEKDYTKLKQHELIPRLREQIGVLK
jgi:protein required for attachment to host cells